MRRPFVWARVEQRIANAIIVFAWCLLCLYMIAVSFGEPVAVLWAVIASLTVGVMWAARRLVLISRRRTRGGGVT